MKKSGNTLGSRPRGSLILVKAVVSGFTLHFIRVNDGGLRKYGAHVEGPGKPLIWGKFPHLRSLLYTPKAFSLPHHTMCFKRYSTTLSFFCLSSEVLLGTH
jgi:hypothetical protein